MLARGEDRYATLKSTGAPAPLFTSVRRFKGVLLCHRNFAANTVQLARWCCLKKRTDALTAAHQPRLQCVCGIFGPMLYGLPWPSPGVKNLPDCLKMFRPTVMVLVPLYVETFHRRIWEKAQKRARKAS